MFKCLVFSLILPLAIGLTFTSPPLLASVGKINAPLFKQLLPVVNPAIFGTNVSVQIAIDYTGCFPSAQNWKGKVAWNANLASCDTTFGLSQNFIPQWKAFQDAGALGIIESIFVGSGEFTATKIFNGYPQPQSIPVVGIGFLNNWTVSMFNPANPQVAFFIFAFPPGFPNITAFFDYPDQNSIDFELTYPATSYGFVLYLGISLGLVGFGFACMKLSLFVMYEGIKFSIPQIELALCILCCIFLLLELLFGPQFGCSKLTYGPVSFFQLHFVPYWYAAITIYSFYLAEVATITASTLTGLDKFKWPACFVIFALFVVELVTASLFAAFPSTISFPQMVQMLGIVYIICCSLVIILTAFATIMLLRVLISTGRTNQVIIFSLRGGAFVVLLVMSLIVPIFLVQGTFQDQQHVVSSVGLMWSATALACILISSIFNISLQKEIELSKSGTSSTSSMSSGKSTSGSSSSSNHEPVIEL